ncbi:UbiD family decarboxylase [Desulfovibrio litoralis]|uniref:4-hydroxy-3-polyprenylbenzoate decarboxylase n=1 Tax=Desulfovibrio litoralis DSM 11393 TaxID=1121455 RepID=A0A1M7SAN2_9BACT|nr:UbiD family decarboxylase [Desulfovibrio litoralis]SHN55503.1 4-hydroxy-3-polyprenylbenzoate decarboxylase [Desulfovibrio litoralis DSM 11393]
MLHRNLTECVNDLEANGQLKRIDIEVDPYLELGLIQRLALKKGSPALLFTNVKGCQFPMLANLFGSKERVRFIFRSSLKGLKALLKLKLDPRDLLRNPLQYKALPRALWATRPRFVNDGAVTENSTTISKLPQLLSWKKDGGAYITLPQVYSESIKNPGIYNSNLGMYRIQLNSKYLEQDKEIGLHYQIHRGLGCHHAEALALNKNLGINIFVGGPPALTVAAVMPLPEGMPELLFAGALAGRRIDLIKGGSVKKDGTVISELAIPAEADFAITGYIKPNMLKPEGPFGDHLGYYSLEHDFPVMQVTKVWHRKDAIYPFTTVGRPPQEDTFFGEFIHDLTQELIPQVFTGIKQVHAVDAAGVHPLLLAIGSERYVPFASERKAQELLTNALSLLGNSQTSLSKYLLLTAHEDAPSLSAYDIPAFFKHILERTNFHEDLHFITRTTMDTLDYTGTALNQGSKLIWVAAGNKKRELCDKLPQIYLPEGFHSLQLFSPGIAVVSAPKHTQQRGEQDEKLKIFLDTLNSQENARKISLLVLCDDADFCSADWDNFLWVTFTRSDPATDIYGLNENIHAKHWRCDAPLIIDARKKEFHAPELELDPKIEQKVLEMGSKNKPLHGII